MWSELVSLVKLFPENFIHSRFKLQICVYRTRTIEIMWIGMTAHPVNPHQAITHLVVKLAEELFISDFLVEVKIVVFLMHIEGQVKSKAELIVDHL